MGSGPRIPTAAVLPYAEAIVAALRETWPDVTICGSIRRGEPTVSDVDILLVGDPDYPLVLEKIRRLYPARHEPGHDGKPRQRYVLFPDSPVPLDVDIWTVPEERRGAGLLYCTGPGMLNTVMRRWARFNNLRLTLHGLFDLRGTLLAGRTEEEICAALEWPWVPPEKRAHGSWVDLAAPFLDRMSEAEFT